MYIAGDGSNAVYEYNLTTAWDFSTASFFQSFSVSLQETNPKGLFFKPDGTKMYITGFSGDDVNEYDLSTAWDISTASFLQNFSVSAQEASPTDLFFKPDGTKMYIIGLSGDAVYEYDLSTAWNISTATFVSSFSVATLDNFPNGVSFKPDGTRMYFVGEGSKDVHEYSLSTDWDVTSATLLSTFSVGAQDGSPQSLVFKSDGSKMYIVGGVNDTVFQYSTGTAPSPATITYPSSVEFPGGTSPAAPAVGETDLLTFYTTDGGTSYYGVQAGNALA
jgi:sugar lactone lactonase YvrE